MNNAPRRPLYAVLMSLILPGFGQLYNGEVNKAIWLFLAFSLLSIPGVVLIALYLPSAWMMPMLILGLILTLSVWVYGLWDAWRCARERSTYVRAPWQVSSVYVLVFILCDILAVPLLTGYVRAHQVEAFTVPSASMMPTIEPHDFIFADKRYNCPGCHTAVQRGDIAIFVYPNNRTRYYIKRIIGLPGDRVQIKGQAVSVNGQPLTVRTQTKQHTIRVTEAEGQRHWQVEWRDAGPATDIDTTVPPGQVYVLGDNRSAATDSRTFGTVPLRDVVGKARQIWFSWGEGGVRWSRLGRVLDE